MTYSQTLNNNKVDFVTAGVQKAGTTALSFYLRSHLLVCMTKEKEGRFFDKDEYFQSKKVNYDIYHSP